MVEKKLLVSKARIARPVKHSGQLGRVGAILGADCRGRKFRTLQTFV